MASPAARAQTYYLSLEGLALDLPTRAVSVEQVVDGRTGNPPIGIVYRGLGGKSAAVAFREGAAVELTRFLQLQTVPYPTYRPVVFCLRALHIGETMGGTREQASAELTADVYEHRPTGYHFVQRVSAHASAYGREITGRHPGHLAQLLTQCINQLSGADWDAAVRQPARTLAQLPADAPTPLAASGRRGAAILRAVPRRGIYYQFEQFLANQPDTTTRFVVDTLRRRRYRSPLATAQWLGVARVDLRAAQGAGSATVPDDLWGFSDGQQVFMRYDKQFFPLMRQGSAFTFVGEAPLDQMYAAVQSQRQAKAGVMGGLIGGVIAGATTGGMHDHTAEPMAYGLDLQTGAVGPYPGHAAVRPDTAFLYVYRAPEYTAAPPLKVVVEGREIGALGPGQYLEVPWARFGKPLHLCIGNWPVPNPCQYLVPNTAQLNYLKINAPAAAPPWQWVPPAQGAADLDALDRLKK